jgi:endonuclease/exonuclease/phosphatase family metal-dependent hydrolase
VFETRDGESQARTFAEALGLHYAYAPGLGLDLAPESLGNAVLSRWPIVATETRSLPAPIDMNELRVVLRAGIAGPRGPLEGRRADNSDSLCSGVRRTALPDRESEGRQHP